MNGTSSRGEEEGQALEAEGTAFPLVGGNVTYGKVRVTATEREGVLFEMMLGDKLVLLARFPNSTLINKNPGSLQATMLNELYASQMT